jgi:hypothetical protein
MWREETTRWHVERLPTWSETGLTERKRTKE